LKDHITIEGHDGAFAAYIARPKTLPAPAVVVLHELFGVNADVENGLSKAGLMLFMQLDQGAVLQKETGQDTPRIIRFLVGNPLIMKEMAKHVPDAGSYAPVTVLVDERADGVHLSYDTMASLLAPYGNRDALDVARDLNSKVEDLLRNAAG
jgi:uncharacterized protein (DUF302 family)